MSEELQDLAGPSDNVNTPPFGLLLDDTHRRNVLLAPIYRQIIQQDEDGEPRIVGLKTIYPNAAAVISAGLSTQNNLLDLNPYQAQAKKMEYDVICRAAGLPYRRNSKVRTSLIAAQFSFNNTIDGMSHEGTFSLLLTKLTGSIREFITGVRGGEKKQ